MLAWIWRGVRRGRVTTAYPQRPEPAPSRLRGRISVIQPDGADPRIAEVCPTGAIAVDDGRVSIDRGRCILCGLCVASAPDRFAFEARHETATRGRDALWVGTRSSPPANGTGSLATRAGALRRSIHIRHVDAGSDGGEEWEIAALTNPYYDMQRLGLFFTAAPRHADILLVTGAGTASMREPLLRTWEAMPFPKAVVAVGTDACSGGLAEQSIGAGGIQTVLPVDVFVPGSPPTPIAILHGLLLAAGIVHEEAV
jgi:Ni,Fe-hydrogenase III small subunit/NAD-dependent dihydropyrimidine dehydrogenase PreA subunit